MDKETLYRIGAVIVSDCIWPVSAGYSVAREAHRGVVEAGNPTTTKAITEAALKGIQYYYPIWDRPLQLQLAEKFTKGYQDEL